MRGWWQEITGLVLPVTCAGCGRHRTALCDACAWALHGRPARRARPTPPPEGLPEVRAAAPYSDAVRAVLLAHKERGALRLAAPLGRALAGAVRGVGGEVVGVGPLLLVPVPSARRAVRARGHDAVRRVAMAAAGELRRTGTAARVVPVLRQRRPVADQAGLDARQRLANMAGALEVVPGGVRLLREGRGVVVVDDLMTTGSSLAEAARAVRAALESAAADPGAYPVPGPGPYRGPYRGLDMDPYADGDADAGVVQRGSGGGAVFESGGAVVLGAAVVAVSPKALEINRN
ncbi:ComF family protein [Streptomyces sp. TRM64462]|uniref:ComF family protein n=1 Tax=Streptomyces sp. TRM64462 TaxID=2741726 RepID=UPI0015861FDB|nr:ComF family protein [Streptomyces sp. TRM64462]